MCITVIIGRTLYGFLVLMTVGDAYYCHWCGLAKVGALIMRTGFWGIVYYNYNKEPPRNSIGNYAGPYTKPPKIPLTAILISLFKRNP